MHVSWKNSRSKSVTSVRGWSIYYALRSHFVVIRADPEQTLAFGDNNRLGYAAGTTCMRSVTRINSRQLWELCEFLCWINMNNCIFDRNIAVNYLISIAVHRAFGLWAPEYSIVPWSTLTEGLVWFTLDCMQCVAAHWDFATCTPIIGPPLHLLIAFSIWTVFSWSRSILEATIRGMALVDKFINYFSICLFNLHKCHFVCTS